MMRSEFESGARPGGVFVLGHRGMLGHVVARYLQEQGCEVVISDARYTGRPRDALVEAVRESGCDWVINAIGKIPQRCADPDELLQANALLPVHLSTRTLPNQQLIHASTDCVFNGQRGLYRVDEACDAEDEYGFSKLLGEAIGADPRTTVIRTSIIGPDLTGGHGLMGWFLSQTDEVRGFVNHFWNGLTTLEWAKITCELIQGRLAPGTVYQAATRDGTSKYELLRLIGEVWNHPIPISPVKVDPAVDRRLVPTLVRKPLREQLEELRSWYEGAA